MADWLNIAGGAAKGYTEGTEDIRRKQEFDSLQRQRQRVEKQQKLDDELTATLKGIRGPGEYTDATPANSDEAAPGFTGPPSGTKKVTVTPTDYTQAQAAALARDGRPSNIVAAQQLRQTALATQAAERAEKVGQASDVVRNASTLLANNDLEGAVKTMQAGAPLHLGGHQIVTREINGVPHMTVADASSKAIQPWVPITRASVAAMLDQGRAALSDQNYYQQKTLGIHQQQADAQSTTAAASMQNAQAAYQKTLWETGDQAQALRASHQAYYESEAALNRARAGAVGAAASAPTYGTPLPIVDANGNVGYMTPVRKGNQPETAQITQAPAGWSFMKQPQQLTDFQKDRLKVLDDYDQAGYFKDKGSDKVNEARRSEWIKANQLGGVFKSGDDPYAAAMNKKGDPDKPAEKPSSPEELKALEKKAAERKARNAAVKVPVNPRVQAQEDEYERLRKERLARNAAVPG